MDTGCLQLHGTEIRYAFLKSPDHHWMQVLYTIVPRQAENIATQIETIEKAEQDFYRTFHISDETAAAKRIFSSDLINHSPLITAYRNRRGSDFFMSITEQSPANGSKLCLLGMCLSNITNKRRDGHFICLDTTSALRHIFIEHLVDPEADENTDSRQQTTRILESLQQKLADYEATIENSVLRTWIYVPHVDADYSGVVQARKTFFNAINLTEDTHYIASTAIQGGTGERFSRVSMDVYAVLGLPEGDIRYIHAPDHLCPTHKYGVTFERATAVKLGFTDFLFISGTASIDKNGEIVHPGNIEKQTERTLENISALLAAAGFDKEDLSSFIVYLRDITDYTSTKVIIDQYLENLPAVYVKGSVCRPGWLIEIEATAARAIT